MTWDNLRRYKMTKWTKVIQDAMKGYQMTYDDINRTKKVLGVLEILLLYKRIIKLYAEIIRNFNTMKDYYNDKYKK